MTIKALIAMAAGVAVVLSPSAVACFMPQGVSPESDAWSSVKELGPAGFVAVGILVIIRQFVKAISPKAERWLDAGVEEREAMRDLAKSLKDRFDEEGREDRKLMREALDEMRNGRRP